MKRIALVLLLLLFIPSGLAQGGAVLGASVSLEFPLDMATMVEVNPERPLVSSGIDGTETPTSPASCGEDLLSPSVAFRGFLFQEENTENGCAEARFLVSIPKGANAMDAIYRAERTSTQSASAGVASLDVEFIQELRLYAEDNLEIPAQVRTEFESSLRTATTGQDRQVVPLILPEGETFVLAWYFEDRGSAPNGASVLVAGQILTGRVSEPSVRFHGMPADDVQTERIRGAADSDSVSIETHISAAIPAGLPVDTLASLRFQVSDSLDLRYVMAPDGTRLNSNELEVTEANSVLAVTVPSEHIANHGPGAYLAVFAALEPLEISAPLVFAVLFLMIFPVPAGIYATRGTQEFVHMAVGSYQSTAIVLRRSLWGWWVAYGLLLIGVVAGQMWPLIVSWPIEVQAAVMHIGFGVISAVFLFMGLYWRRKLMHMMEEDLEEKQRTNVELARSNQELEQFAYVASHDLQEPLRTISRFTQLIKHRYGKELPEEANEFMDYTVEGATRMQSLVDDLLAFSQVGNANRPLEDVSLQSVVDQVTAALGVAIEENKATITMDELPTVHGDRAQLAQLYQNLLSNALKFRSPRRRPKIHLGAKKQGKDWILFVDDNGIGMEKEHHERIFVIFQRLHGRDEYRGTGIGLAVVKKIVERHGGKVWVESTPGKGTTFFFSLKGGSGKVES